MTLRLQKHPFNRLRLRRLLLHIAGWLVFMSYELTLLFFFNFKWGRVGEDVLYYGVNIGFFYLHACALLPFAFNPKRKAWAVLPGLLLLEIAGYLSCKYLVDAYLGSVRLPFPERSTAMRYLFLSAWRGFYFLGLASVYWLFRRVTAYRQGIAEAEKSQLRTQKEKAELEKDLAEVNYAYLQQQISPHFLFNSLNFVYNSVYKISPAASDVVLRLSEMMRYALRETDLAGKVELQEEVAQIRNLITISSKRYDFPLYLELSADCIPAGPKIIPLVLLTLAENVFKHGSLKDKAQPARIVIRLGPDNLLSFVTWNRKKATGSAARLKSLGMHNTIRRLQYAYPGAYTLDIKEEAETFQLELTLHL